GTADWPLSLTSKFHDQVRLANSFHRHGNHPALHFDPDLAVGEPRQTALEKFLIPDRVNRRDARQPSGKPFELGRFGQLAVEPRGTHLKDIMRPRNQIFHVHDHAELIADGLAILVADALGLIDVDAEEALLADLPFNVDHFHAQRPRHALGRFADALQIHLCLPHYGGLQVDSPPPAPPTELITDK